MPGYWVVSSVRNAEKTIGKSIGSLLNQSLKPSLICIVDDGSADSTPEILLDYKTRYSEIFHIITLPDMGYDIRRIVFNFNRACEYVETRGANFEFSFISSDDTVFPSNYVHTLAEEMEKNAKLVVASGTRGIRSFQEASRFPEGAGRLVRSSFFGSLGYRYPPFYGYEPWLVYKALQMGYEIKKLENLRYEHLRGFGTGHKFVEFGPAMKCLGYHPMYVLARSLKNIFTNSTSIPIKYSLKMVWDYINESKWSDDPYYHYYEPELRKYVRNLQKKKLLALLKPTN